MARYDVYAGRGERLLVDVRAEPFAALRRIVVVPLLPVAKAPPLVSGLNPVLTFRGAPHALMTQYIESVPREKLGAPLDTLDPYWDDILRALDFLVTGL